MRREVKVSFSDKHALDRTIMGVMKKTGLDIQRVNGSDLKMFMFKVIYTWLGLRDIREPEALSALERISSNNIVSDIMGDFIESDAEK